MVATQWVNPDNEKVPDGEDYYPADGDVAGGIPGMYRLLAICYLLLGFLGSSLLSNPEEEVRGAGVKLKQKQRTAYAHN